MKELLLNGHEVKVAAPFENEGFRKELNAMGIATANISLQRNSVGPLSDIKYMFQLIAEMRRFKPDLVFTYTVKPNVFGAIAAKLCAIRSIAMVTGLGLAFVKEGGNGSISGRFAQFAARKLYRLSTGFNEAVIFQNPDDASDFVAEGCLADTSKIRMVNGSGVDTGYYQPALLPDKPVFLMLARLLKSKGVKEYCEAAQIVRSRYPQARFLLGGPFDSGMDSITPTELTAWSGGVVELLGMVEDVRPVIAQCRVYVLPSYREGTPRSVLEAMAMQRPIITSDAPGCRETVENGVNGWLVPVRDATLLAERMIWMLENPDRCKSMAAESLQFVQEKYDIKAVNRVMLHHLGLAS